MFNRFLKLYQTQVSALPLGLYRIAFAAVLFAEVAQLFYFKELIFDHVPFVEPSRWPHGVLILVWLVVIGLLGAGVFTRLQTILNYGFCVFYFGLSMMPRNFDYHVDGLFITASLLMIFMPVGKALSVDRLLERRRGGFLATARVSAVHAVFLIFAIGLVYLDSMFYKLSSPMYMAGLGAWAPTTLPYTAFHFLPVVPPFEWAARGAGYFVLCYEFLFMFLIWFSRLRLMMVLLGIVLHVGILLAFPIPWFSLMMLALFVGIVPGEIYERLFALVGRQRTDLSTPSSPSPRTASPSWAPRPAFGFMILWLFSFLVIAQSSPLHRLYGYWNPQAAWSIARLSNYYKGHIYPVTGWSQHPVFMHTHFEGYSRQLILFFRKKDGTLTPLPMSDHRGMVGPYNTGRQWVNWTFRIADTRKPPEHTVAMVNKYIAFWAGKNGVDLRQGEVVVAARDVDVSLVDWKPEQLERNVARKIVHVGAVPAAADAPGVELDQLKSLLSKAHRPLH